MNLSLTPFVERLRAGGCRQAEGVLEFSAQTVEPRSLPAFFVVPTAETAQGSPNVGNRDQAVDVGISVMVVVDGARRNQTGISEELQTQTRKVRAALVGWTHPEASRACDYAGGKLASARGSAVVWEVRLKSRYHERKAT